MTAVAQLNAALAGRYVVDREIGAGGMATVCLARDVKHDRNVGDSNLQMARAAREAAAIQRPGGRP